VLDLGFIYLVAQGKIGSLAVHGPIHDVAGLAQGTAEGIAQRGIVLDQQNTHRLFLRKLSALL